MTAVDVGAVVTRAPYVGCPRACTRSEAVYVVPIPRPVPGAGLLAHGVDVSGVAYAVTVAAPPPAHPAGTM